jgi:hypothetical protein
VTWAFITFVCAAAFFAVGAACNKVPASWRTVRELIEVSLIVVVIVGLATGGRGCSTANTTSDEARSLPIVAGSAG